VALPDPKPGLVIRYDYLRNREAASGRDHGKDRPACLVAASDSNTKPRFVVILPITHSAPAGNTIGIAIPPRVRQALGLDDEPCWVIVSEHNVDAWPNGGLAELAANEDDALAPCQQLRIGGIVRHCRMLPYASEHCKNAARLVM
jgi:hypothetical protein